MRQPDEDLRRHFASWSAELRTAEDEQAEQGLAELLDNVHQYLQEDLDRDGIRNEEEAESVLATANVWAAIASQALAEVYAPMSPFPRRLAGWSQNVSTWLQSVVKALHSNVQAAVNYLKPIWGIVSFSIGVSFPWAGVQISLEFS